MIPEFLACVGWHRIDKLGAEETFDSWIWGEFTLRVHEKTIRGYQGVTDWGYRVYVWAGPHEQFYPAPNPLLRQ